MTLITGLEDLVQYIHACCSEDESHSKEEEAEHVHLGRKRKRKVCKTLRLKWRSLRLEMIFRKLDDRRREDLLGSPTKQAGTLGCIRERGQEKEGKIGPATGLPIDFYDTQWLSTLTSVEVSQLEIQIQPGLPGFFKILDL